MHSILSTYWGVCFHLLSVTCILECEVMSLSKKIFIPLWLAFVGFIFSFLEGIEIKNSCFFHQVKEYLVRNSDNFHKMLVLCWHVSVQQYLWLSFSSRVDQLDWNPIEIESKWAKFEHILKNRRSFQSYFETCLKYLSPLCILKRVKITIICGHFDVPWPFKMVY